MKKAIALLLGVMSYLIPSLKKADSKEGIQETKEAVVAVNEIGILVMKRVKDGVQFADFVSFCDSFTKDEEFKNKVKVGYDNYKKIPAEIHDCDTGEGLEIAQVQLEYIPKIIDALKHEEVEVKEAVEEAKVEAAPQV